MKTCLTSYADTNNGDCKHAESVPLPCVRVPLNKKPAGIITQYTEQRLYRSAELHMTLAIVELWWCKCLKL